MDRGQCSQRNLLQDKVPWVRATAMETAWALALAMETAQALTSALLCKCRRNRQTWDCCSRISANTLGNSHPPHRRRLYRYFDSNKQNNNRPSCPQPNCPHLHPHNPDLGSGWLSMCLDVERAKETAEETVKANTARKTSHRQRDTACLADCTVA